MIRLKMMIMMMMTTMMTTNMTIMTMITIMMDLCQEARWATLTSKIPSWLSSSRFDRIKKYS